MLVQKVVFLILPLAYINIWMGDKYHDMIDTMKLVKWRGISIQLIASHIFQRSVVLKLFLYFFYAWAIVGVCVVCCQRKKGFSVRWFLRNSSCGLKKSAYLKSLSNIFLSFYFNKSFCPFDWLGHTTPLLLAQAHRNVNAAFGVKCAFDPHQFNIYNIFDNKFIIAHQRNTHQIHSVAYESGCINIIITIRMHGAGEEEKRTTKTNGAPESVSEWDVAMTIGKNADIFDFIVLKLRSNGTLVHVCEHVVLSIFYPFLLCLSLFFAFFPVWVRYSDIILT